MALVLLCASSARSQTPSPPPREATSDLSGPTWQMVEFQGSDGKKLIPDDKAKYTISFERDGNVSVRFDCNRGRGGWKSAGLNQLEFGPLALTRAMCPPGSLHDQLAKQWPLVRSYTLRDGHLFLALMADGGIYEFEPMSKSGLASGQVKGTATYRERMALPLSSLPLYLQRPFSFHLSRWRGRRCACDTSDIMGCHSILNRFSPSAYKALFFCIFQAKTDSIPII